MSNSVIDARLLAPWDRHSVIMGQFDDLAMGQDFLLIADHDPLPLFHQFHSLRSNEFGWSYLEQGPEAWQVRITRVGSAKPQSDGNCCGHCGG